MSASQRQEFCVRWNSHLGSIGAAFPQLLAGQRFVDVTLACEGHQVHCHRLVLAACSSYFESILAENPCKHPVIILPSEIKLWEIQALVDFMYKGEVNVTQAGLPQLLRCAEQLRIRGLYGSDAALNLNQLKALTSKAAAAAAAAAAANAMNAGGGGGSGGGGSAINDNSMETDDTNSTTTTTATAASALQQLQAGSMAAAMAAQQHQQLHHLKKELPALQQQQHHHYHHHQQQSNGTIAQNVLQQNHNLQQLHLPQIKQEVTGLTHVVNAAAAIAAAAANSNAATEEDDESADDSTSNAYDRYEQYTATQQGAAAGNNVAAATANVAAIAAAHAHLDSTVEDDHNYVAHDEDSSYGPSADTEHETSANSSSATLLQGAVDAAGSYKRVRRSEASLAQAAKCVSKGQTFQTVSNMFNIPVSTIRFYMARKGILPRRKRGRGASSANSAGAAGAMNAVSAAAMSQALAQMKRSGSPPLTEALYHHQLVSSAAGGGAAGASYKLNEQGAAHLI